MKGFLDIEGTEICVGDEILWTSPGYSNSASSLVKGKVTRFTKQTMFIDEEIKSYVNSQGRTCTYKSGNKMMMGQTDWRVLIIKGEFKEYTKKEIADHAGEFILKNKE